MGAGESTEKLGQRVLIAKSKLASDLKTATERYQYLKQHSPGTLKTLLESVAASFETCAPFLESTLLIAWFTDAKKCQEIVLNACKKVLRAPIKDDEYKWFQQYVFSSNIWMMKINETGRFLYEELLAVGNEMSSGIVAHMDSIFEHLESHKQWHKVTAIQNDTLVSRQDDKKVGLLKDSGLTNVFEMKTDDEKTEELKTFVDSNMAINILTSTAAKLNNEFQKHVKLVTSSHGTFKEAPMKKVERSLGKVENDYNNEAFPKSAKLLDLIRCSVTFNTVEQLLKGYEALMRHIKANPSIIELARVKNGFIDTSNTGGYRDIKVNVVYKSQNPEHPNVKMICEVQLLLINYLEEKKKIHKLYSILREETFFKMVVSEQTEKRVKDMKELGFKEALSVTKSLTSCNTSEMYKCSVDNDFGLLGMESSNWFGCVEMKSKKEVWSLKRTTSSVGKTRYGFQTHAWVNIGQQKYLSVQTDRNKIQMFNVKQVDDALQFVEDKKYELVYSDSGLSSSTITFCDFDQDFKNIFLIVDNKELQKRAVSDINTTLSTIKLAEDVSGSGYRNFRLSADGKYCVAAGGDGKSYFYIVDIDNEVIHILKSDYLKSSYVPCFINGESQFVAVSSIAGRVEIWDLQKKESVKQFQVEPTSWVRSSASANNILAIGTVDRRLRLYDVRTWECFYTKQFECQGNSLHLTEDLKYITFAGHNSQGKESVLCSVLQIE